MTRPYNVVETEWCVPGAHWTLTTDAGGSCPACSGLEWALRRSAAEAKRRGK